MGTELARVEHEAIAEYIPSVSVSLEQAKENFQRLQIVTKELMELGVDYGTIPGTPKPSLLKPGAEHLLQFFGLGHRVARVAALEDWEQGFFCYCYRVTVFKARPMPDGSVYEQVIAECEGSANSKEKRYRNQDVFTIVNTLQKMAIKRALVGATLQATGTSGMFTQDIEDMDIVPDSQTLRDPASVVLTFGKHQGKTLGQLMTEAPDYVRWLADSAKDPAIQQAAKALLEDGAPRPEIATQPGPPPAERSGPNPPVHLAAPPPDSPESMVFQRGKHQGKTYAQVLQEDRQYLEWFAVNADQMAHRAAAQAVLDAAPKPAPISGAITEPQRKRLFALAKEAGISHEDIKDYIKSVHGKESSKDLTRSEYEDVCKWIEAAHQANDEWPESDDEPQQGTML